MAEENVFEASGFKNLRSELKIINAEMQQLIINGQQTSDRFTQLAQRAGSIKDAVEDANDAQKAFTGAGLFKGAAQGISALTGGFNAIQGAIALSGGEAKDFEKTLTNLAAGLSLTQGIAALEDLPKAFSNVKKAGVGAFQAIKAAIGATGIGLLVIALGTIYAYWEDIMGAISGVSAEQKALNKETAKNLELQTESLAALEGSEEVLKLQGKTEDEIYKLKIKQYDTTINAAEASLAAAKITKDAQVEASERNKTILQGIIRFLTLPLTTLLATVDMVGRTLGKEFNLEEKFSGGLAKLVFDPEEVREEGDKTIKAAEKVLRDLNNKRAGLINGHNAKVKADADKVKQDREDSDDKENKKQLEVIKERIAAEDKIYVEKAATEDERERRSLETSARQQEEAISREIEGYEALVDRTKEQNDTLILLREQYNATLLANDLAYKNLVAKQDEAARKKKEEEDKASDEKAKQDKQQKYQDDIKALKDKYALEEKALVDSNKTKRELDKELFLTKEKQLQDEIALAKKYGEATAQLELDLAKLRKDQRDKEKEDRKQDLKDQIDGVLTTAAAVANAVVAANEAKMAKELKAAEGNEAKQEEIKKKYFEENKKGQIAQAIISTLQGALGAFSSLAGIPVVGPVLAGIAAAAALASGYAQVQTIKNTTYQGSGGSSGSKSTAETMYAEGGLLMGPSHDVGGIRTSMGELEGGEFVVNRRATANFLPLLQAINSQGNTAGPEGNASYQQPVIKTYVVASDVTSQQEINAKLSALARM